MNTQVLKVIAAFMLFGSLILAALAWRIVHAPQPAADRTKTSAPEPTPEPPHKIVTAARRILAGQVIGDQDVSLTPVAAVPAGGIENPAEVIGKVPVAAIPQGRAILSTDLPSGSPLTRYLNDDERAMAIKVDEVSGVGGFLHPGDMVDVIVYLRGDNQTIKGVHSKILLKGTRILAYGEEIPGNPGDVGKSKQGKGTAVLAVHPEEAARLTLADNAGLLRLALRPSGQVESDLGEHASVTLEEIFTRNEETRGAVKQSGPTVEIYRSGNKVQVQFP